MCCTESDCLWTFFLTFLAFIAQFESFQDFSFERPYSSESVNSLWLSQHFDNEDAHNINNIFLSDPLPGFRLIELVTHGMPQCPGLLVAFLTP